MNVQRIAAVTYPLVREPGIRALFIDSLDHRTDNPREYGQTTARQMRTQERSRGHDGGRNATIAWRPRSVIVTVEPFEKLFLCAK